MAIDNSWVITVEIDIYTIIKTRLISRLASRYPSLNITQQDEENAEAVFPTVYIHFLPSVEVGQDIGGTSINGIRCTVEWSVVVSAQQGNTLAREIAGHIISAFKELAFDNVSSAELQNKSQDTVRMVGRLRRTIGQSDILN